MSNYIKDNKKIMNEYDYEKNKGIDLDTLTTGSGKKIWWICDKGHSYLMSVVNKAKRKNSCPICSNRIVLEGYNDLKTKFPELVKEWNYKKNKNLTPEKVVSGSNKKVWWICQKCGYEWEATIVSRTITGNGCRNCAINSVGNKIKSKKHEKYGDLTKTHPELVKEWNSEKNGKKLPANIIINSPEKFWWKCSKCNYEWQASLYNRINKKSGCPKCGILKQIQSFNNNQIIKKGSLEENNPTLAKEWNFERNKNLTPDKIIVTSNKKVCWKCSNGHEWIASICKRNNGTGCPYCDKSAKKKVKNIDTGKIFDSLSAAAKSCGLKTGDTISNCCKGKQKSAGGFRWKFVENKQF